MKKMMLTRSNLIKTIEPDPIDTKQFRIAGFVPLSTVDWPDQLAAVIFTQGCPWRCRYCHNSHLIPPCGENLIEWETVISTIEKRKQFLDGVVISGGEPLLQRGLNDVLQQIRQFDLKTGLHTSGALPKQFRAALPLLDWVGFDIKATPDNYAQLTHRQHSGSNAWQSLDILLQSRVPYEVRITVHPELMQANQLDKLLNCLTKKNVQHVRLQKARAPFLDQALGSATLNEHYQAYVNQHAQHFASILWR